MYVIIVYDIEVERVNKVNKFLKLYLHWRQNSVFEGEISKAQLTEITEGLREIINEDMDSVIIYRLPSKRNLKLEILGVEKNQMDMIL